jgi:predicted nucleic acid-binding Zn ribbon protein
MERSGKEVERELARSGSRNALPLAAITAAWPAAVGETVARNAWPARIARDGTLHVATSSSTWAFELDRLADEIGSRLHRELGEATPAKLRFAVGQLPEPGGQARAAQRPAPPTPVPAEVARDVDAAAASIADPELRELVARAARASLGRAASDRHF